MENVAARLACERNGARRAEGKFLVSKTEIDDDDAMKFAPLTFVFLVFLTAHLLAATPPPLVPAPGSAVGQRTVILDTKATIPANSAAGFKLGAVKQGDIITLQYIDGKWKGHGHIPTENPDTTTDSEDESRLVIARPPKGKKPGDVIVVVPRETTTKPFVYTVATTRDDVILRINKNSDNKDNPGSVVYQVTITR